MKPESENGLENGFRETFRNLQKFFEFYAFGSKLSFSVYNGFLQSKSRDPSYPLSTLCAQLLENRTFLSLSQQESFDPQSIPDSVFGELTLPVMGAVPSAASLLMLPFSNESVYFQNKTPALKYDFFSICDENVQLSENSITEVYCQHAYEKILNDVYKGAFKISPKPIYLKCWSKDSHEKFFYRLDICLDYLAVLFHSGKPRITGEIIEQLQKTKLFSDWAVFLPPEKFIFSGFMVLHFVDSSQSYLLRTITNLAQEKLQTISARWLEFQESFLQLAGLDSSVTRKISLFYRGDLFEVLLENEKVVLRPIYLDSKLTEHASKNPFISLCENESGSFFVKPSDMDSIGIPGFNEMITKDHFVLGWCENWDRDFSASIFVISANTHDAQIMKSRWHGQFDSLMRLLLTSLKNHIAETVQTQIVHDYSSIHSSVLWQLQKAALRVEVREKFKDTTVQLSKKLVFPDVEGLFGFTTFKNYGHLQYHAVLTDLKFQLNQLSKTFEHFIQLYPALGSLQETRFRISRFLTQLTKEFGSTLEGQIHQFLKLEIKEIISDVIQRFPKCKLEIEEALPVAKMKDGLWMDEQSKMIQFHETVLAEWKSLINEKQEDMQSLMPHYFKSNSKVGLEHYLFMGKSLEGVQDYSVLQSNNLRLWQLKLMCELQEIYSKNFKETNVNLDPTHLVVALDTKIDLKYSDSEKTLDFVNHPLGSLDAFVAEVVKLKKKDSREKVTQPGMLSVVVNSTQLKNLYNRYFEFLSDTNFIDGKVEIFPTEEISGCRDLMCMRAAIGNKAALEDGSNLAVENNGELQKGA